MLLFAGYAVKADNAKPHIVYVDSKDSVKMQLQVKIAMQEIQIKDLMHEKQELTQDKYAGFFLGMLFIAIVIIMFSAFTKPSN